MFIAVILLNEAYTEIHVEKEPEALEPLHAQVFNTAPAPKKKKIEVDSEEATQRSSEAKSEILANNLMHWSIRFNVVLQ